jgi:hypothetical protein
MKKSLKIKTLKSVILFKKLESFASAEEIILFVNNNVKELLLEIEYLDYDLKDKFYDLYITYREQHLQEPWEYSFFPSMYYYKLKNFYKNIVIRLHHFSKDENIEFYWYTIFLSTYDAICIYKEKGEIIVCPAEFLLLSEYNYLNEQEESLNKKECKKLIVAFKWDQEKFCENEKSKVMLYKEKTKEEIEKYKRNFQIKENPNKEEGEGFEYYKKIGYNQNLVNELEQAIEKNKIEKYIIENIEEEIKNHEEYKTIKNNNN